MFARLRSLLLQRTWAKGARKAASTALACGVVGEKIPLTTGGILSAEEVRDLQKDNVEREKMQVRYVSTSYLECVRRFNEAQFNATGMVSHVQCPTRLSDLEGKLLQEALNYAGFNNYKVQDYRAVVEIPGRTALLTSITNTTHSPDPESSCPVGQYI